MRKVPEPLHAKVLELSLAIANAGERCDFAKARGAFRRLRGLYRSRRNNPDPFLTEAMADFTGGARSASKLYRLAIEQSAAFPGEPIFTKQIALATRLLQLGHLQESARFTALAKPAAQESGDEVFLDELLELEDALSCP